MEITRAERGWTGGNARRANRAGTAENSLPQLVSSKQAASVLGIPEGTLRYWRCIGTGPAWVKLGRRTLYSVADLIEFVARGRRDPSVRTMEVDDVSL